MFRLSRAHHVTAVAALTLSMACGDSLVEPPPGSPPADPGAPENISVVVFSLVSTDGLHGIISLAEDPDGSQHPLQDFPADQLVFHKGLTYNGNVTLLDDLDPGHVLSISNEVLAESNFHRFFYGLTCAGVTVATASLNRDTQSPSQPFGATFQLVVSPAAAVNPSCSLNVQLRHFRTGKGDGSGANFQQDISIDFPVSIQP